MADITIIADKLNFGFYINASVTIQYVTPTQSFAGESLTFDCIGYGADGELAPGLLTFDFSIDGEWLNKTIDAESLDFDLSISGEEFIGITIVDATFDMLLDIEWATTDLLLEKFKDSWVKWSQIGSADFTIGRDNIAGEMPMDWRGQIYDIRKLGKKVMVYGVNGVSELIPAGNAFGLNTIYNLGLMGRNAVCGDDTHYFIDKIGQLWRVSEGLKKLDYSEYLSELSSPVMSWDNEKNLIYICDGTIGFVYSPDSNSLGSGPVNVAGIRYQDGESYITAPDTITIPTFELTTDIYDFGTRKEKTIFGFEISTNLSGSLQASIDYRTDLRSSFRSLSWVGINPHGKVTLPCYGVEFRFKVRALEYEYFEIDWLKVNGVIHGFSHLDIQG